MTHKDTETEEVIKQAAKKLFFVEGRFNATTQEIADAAGVNRTLLNYYFRSRNKLFDLVLKDARKQFRERMKYVFRSTLSFKEKIEQFIEVFLSEAVAFPYLETYLVTQLNQGFEGHEVLLEYEEEIKRDMSAFFAEIRQEMDAGTIETMEPVQFLWNLIALLSFPVAMKPLYMRLMDIPENEYRRLLQDRKQIIISTLFK